MSPTLSCDVLCFLSVERQNFVNLLFPFQEFLLFLLVWAEHSTFHPKRCSYFACSLFCILDISIVVQEFYIQTNVLFVDVIRPTESFHQVVVDNRLYETSTRVTNTILGTQNTHTHTVNMIHNIFVVFKIKFTKTKIVVILHQEFTNHFFNIFNCSHFLLNFLVIYHRIYYLTTSHQNL